MDQVSELWVEEVLARPYTLSRKGYAILYVPGHPWATRSTHQMYRARYIMHALGVLVDRTMVVHHRDRNRLNDHPSNLEVLSKSAHDIIHHAPLPEAQKEKIRQALLGKKHTPERRAKLSEAHKGIPLSDAAKAKVSAAMKGREITWGDKISATHKARGTKPPVELAAAANRGRKKSDEEKAQSRAGALMRWERDRPKYEERARLWASMRATGATLREIAAQQGVSGATVCRVLKGGA